MTLLNKNINDFSDKNPLDGTENVELQEAAGGVGSNKRFALTTLATWLQSALATTFASAAEGAKANSAVQSITAGTNVTVDSTNPQAPVINALGVVESVVAGTNLTVDNTDPKNPKVNALGVVESIVAGSNVTVDNTDPKNPKINASGGSGGSSPLFLSPLVYPVLSNFTAFGTGATFTQKVDRILASVPPASGQLRGANLAVPATPYTVDICADLQALPPASSDTTMWGLSLSDGTKFVNFYIGMWGSADPYASYLTIDSWASSSSFTSAVATIHTAFNAPIRFLRITDDGTTRSYYASTNGKDFILAYSEASGSHLVPTKVGFSMYNTQLSGTTPSKISVYHWLISNSVLGDAA